MLENYTLIAKTLSGLEKVLAEEILQLGGTNIKEARRAVIFKGNKKMMYLANYHLRTALRILKQIESFRFNSVDDFYKKCRKINWDDLMNVENSFAIYSTVSGSREFRNSMFASLKVKDAIADYFRFKTGIRPDVDTQEPQIIFNVRISENNCTLSLDSSGDSLHKRGYRVAQNDAPLNEVLAAGMILLTGWKGDSDFIDPMCGSGTLPVEAALIATKTPPGIFREKFGFEKWPDFDRNLFRSVTEKILPEKMTSNIYASDISERNIGIAKANARKAGIIKEINFRISDFRNLNIKTQGATIIINPPYGKRLKIKESENLYKMVAEKLIIDYHGNTAWILSPLNEFFTDMGLKHSRKINLFNGSLECDYRKYGLPRRKPELL